MEWIATLLKSFARPFQWWVTIGPWERGLRIRLGKVAADLAPGIHFRIPFLDRVYVQSIRLRTIEDTGLTAMTKDGHTITASIAIDFAIEDVREMFNTLSSPEVTLRKRAAAALVAFAYTMSKSELTPGAIESALNGSIVTFGCGLHQIQARLTACAFPRAYRILMNEYSTGAGLYHGFESQPGASV